MIARLERERHGMRARRYSRCRELTPRHHGRRSLVVEAVQWRARHAVDGHGHYASVRVQRRADVELVRELARVLNRDRIARRGHSVREAFVKPSRATGLIAGLFDPRRACIRHPGIAAPDAHASRTRDLKRTNAVRVRHAPVGDGDQPLRILIIRYWPRVAPGGMLNLRSERQPRLFELTESERREVHGHVPFCVGHTARQRGYGGRDRQIPVLADRVQRDRVAVRTGHRAGYRDGPARRRGRQRKTVGTPTEAIDLRHQLCRSECRGRVRHEPQNVTEHVRRCASVDLRSEINDVGRRAERHTGIGGSRGSDARRDRGTTLPARRRDAVSVRRAVHRNAGRGRSVLVEVRGRPGQPTRHHIIESDVLIPQGDFVAVCR